MRTHPMNVWAIVLGTVAAAISGVAVLLTIGIWLLNYVASGMAWLLLPIFALYRFAFWPMALIAVVALILACVAPRGARRPGLIVFTAIVVAAHVAIGMVLTFTLGAWAW